MTWVNVSPKFEARATLCHSGSWQRQRPVKVVGLHKRGTIFRRAACAAVEITDVRALDDRQYGNEEGPPGHWRSTARASNSQPRG